MSKYLSVKFWFNLVLGVVPLLSCLSIRTSVFVVGILFVTSLVHLKPKKVSVNPVLFPIASLALGVIICSVIDATLIEVVKNIEKYAVLVAFPIIFFNFKLIDKHLVTKSFVYTLALFSVYSLVKLLSYSIQNSEFIATQDDTFLQWIYPHLVSIHPTYFSYLIIASAIFVLEGYISNRRIAVLLWFFYSGVVFYLASRTPLAIYLVINVLYLYKRARYKSIRFKFLTLATLSVMFTILALKSEFLTSKMTKVLNDPRLQLHTELLELSLNRDVILGLGAKETERTVRGIGIGNPNFPENQIGMHSNLLSFLFEGGVLSLLLYLPFLLFYVIRYKTTFTTCLFALAFFSGLTESNMFVFKGICLFVFLYCLQAVCVTRAYRT